MVAGLVAVGLLAGGVTTAYLRRISPPWPAVAGDPYSIVLAQDGCPIVPELIDFVDSPGPLVPPDPAEVVLCTIPTGLVPGNVQDPDEPRLRVLRAGAGDFAALLNALPDRNASWRQWQRKHSGSWPDAPPDGWGTNCNLIGYRYEYSFVLRYPDRSPVAVISKCGPWSFTTGARTRTDFAKPHVVDAFLHRFQTQR